MIILLIIISFSIIVIMSKLLFKILIKEHYITIEKNKEKLYLSAINEDLIDQLIKIDDEIKKMNLKNIKNKIYN